MNLTAIKAWIVKNLSTKPTHKELDAQRRADAVAERIEALRLQSMVRGGNFNRGDARR